MFLSVRKAKLGVANAGFCFSIAAVILASSTFVFAQTSKASECNLDSTGFCITESAGGLSVSRSTPQPVQSLNATHLTQKKLNVDFQNGLLRIDAENVTFLETLKAVSVHTGAEVQFPAGALRETIFVHLGPGKPQDVINQLLKGAPFDYLVLSSDSHPGEITRVILTKATSGTESTVAESQAAPASEPAMTQLYGAGFADDLDGAPVETAPIEQPTTSPNSAASQAALFLHPDGSKLSGDELDRLQKMQIQQEQQQFAQELQQQREQQSSPPPPPPQNNPQQ
jgi:predicted component of type VI protein secretion system